MNKKQNEMKMFWSVTCNSESSTRVFGSSREMYLLKVEIMKKKKKKLNEQKKKTPFVVEI